MFLKKFVDWTVLKLKINYKAIQLCWFPRAWRLDMYKGRCHENFVDSCHCHSALLLLRFDSFIGIILCCQKATTNK